MEISWNFVSPTKVGTLHTPYVCRMLLKRCPLEDFTPLSVFSVTRGKFMSEIGMVDRQY